MILSKYNDNLSIYKTITFKPRPYADIYVNLHVGRANARNDDVSSRLL